MRAQKFFSLELPRRSEKIIAAAKKNLYLIEKNLINKSKNYVYLAEAHTGREKFAPGMHLKANGQMRAQDFFSEIPRRDKN